MKFELQSLLKSSLGVETWLGRAGEEAVLVKRAVEESGAWLRLSHEAEVLGRLSHPRIPRLRWLGRGESFLTVVADFIPGSTLEERLAQGPMSVEETTALAEQLLETLRVVHEQGLLHRDLKPSNLIWEQGQLWVIDWGLARSPWLHATVRELPAGTVHYLAPELAGSLRRRVGEPADLYSVGVVLFRCLTGRVPFSGSSVNEVLRQHVSAPVPPFGAEGRLGGVIRELLAKEPDRRPAGAQGALDRLSGRTDRRPGTLLEAPLVGRERELELLGQVLCGSSRLLLVGEAGSGKTRLLEALVARAVGAGWRVLQGQALSRLESVPLQLFSGPLFELAQEADRELAERLGVHGPVLARVAPQLSAWLGTPAPETGPLELGPNLVSSALSALLKGLPGPTLLALDDVQWADGLSLELAGRVELPPGVSLVLAGRSQPAELSGFSRIDLGPLDEAAGRQLLESMLGGLEGPVAAQLLSHASGNPFLLVEGARGVAEHGADELQTSARSGWLLVDRLQALPLECRSVLQRAAALGRLFSLQTLHSLGVSDPCAALLPAQHAGLVWATASESEYSFAHDRIREKVYESLGEERRRQLHRQAAEALIHASPAVQAHHLWQAGEPERARPHALVAAQRSRESFDFGTAAVFYRMALEVEPDDLAAREALADVLGFSHRQSEAKMIYLELLPLLSDPLDRARVRVRLGHLCLCLNRFQEGEEYLLDALSEQ
ncbi:hypothetical protein DYH09_18645 [bacterium CPR1]|nr:hypothetical protein [bacterium CPR1]